MPTFSLIENWISNILTAGHSKSSYPEWSLMVIIPIFLNWVYPKSV